MKNVFAAFAVLIGASLGASATTVQYTLTATGTPDEYTVLFTTNANLAQNQALVVQFPYSITLPTFSNLENPIGGIGYNLYVLQPNSTPLVAGSITAIRSAAGSGGISNLSIEATYLGGSFPLTLPFEIQQFDGSGVSALYQSTIESGTATFSSGASGVPEPSSVILSLSGMIAAGCWAFRRQNR
jgi:hypothetical protein